MTDFELLKTECLGCTACPLSENRTNVVFGVGNQNAEVMFIGEGPGENEDLLGEPFVGNAGKLFDKYLLAVGMKREEVYIANMVKCRPPHNRDPKPEEIDCCIGYLRRQVKLINPKIIVCLGRISAQRLISPEFRVTKEHGHWFKKGGVFMMGTFHPAALLRNPSQKPDAFEDLRVLRSKMKELGIWKSED